MADEVLTVSAAGLLDQARGNLTAALTELRELLDAIREALNQTGDVPDRGPTRQPAAYRPALESTQLRLTELHGTLRGTLGLIEVLTLTSRSVLPPANSVAEAQESSDAIPLGGVSATTRHRMTEIRDSLSLTDQETLERCVATQAYIDERLRGGWRFSIARGRERRTVSFPGQLAV